MDWHDELLKAMSKWLSKELKKGVVVHRFEEDIFAYNCNELEKAVKIWYTNPAAVRPTRRSYEYQSSLGDLIEEMRGE